IAQQRIAGVFEHHAGAPIVVALGRVERSDGIGGADNQVALGKYGAAGREHEYQCTGDREQAGATAFEWEHMFPSGWLLCRRAQNRNTGLLLRWFANSATSRVNVQSSNRRSRQVESLQLARLAGVSPVSALVR